MIFSYSVICVYICVWCVPKKSIKEFRNSSWYQSQFSETLIPSGHLLFRPSFIPAKSLWPSLNPTVSHSGHQSLFSEPREKTLSGRSNRRQKTFTADNFSSDGFFYTVRSAWRRSPIFPKAPEPENHPRAGHAQFFGRRLHLTRRRVRAREAFSGDAPPPPASPDADQPPYLPGSPIRALHVPLLGIFVSVSPPNSLSGEAPTTFSPLQSLHVPWEVFFYLSGGTTPRSEAVSLFRWCHAAI